VEIKFSWQKIGNEYRLFSLLNFPRAAILNFNDVKRLPLLLIKKHFRLFETIGQPFDVIKFQNGGAREI